MTSKCRVCQSTKVAFAFESKDKHGRHDQSDETFTVLQCHNCQAFFIGPIEVSHDYYQNYYQKDYYPTNKLAARILNYISYKIKQHFILKKFNRSKKISLLDIGCGRGEFLLSLPNNITKFGVEINYTSARIAQDNNLKVYNSDIYDIDFKNQKFDCITLWHVFEHLSDPNRTLELIYKLLNHNGIVVLATPNSDSIGFKVGQQNYFHLDTPRHLFIPNLVTLNSILKKNKFDLDSSYNLFYDFPLDLFWSLQKSLWRIIVYPLYPLAKLFSTETIMVIAKKP